MRPIVTSAVLAATLSTLGCGATLSARAADQTPATADMSELWVDPGTTRRDLFWGIGGRRYAPPPDAVYELESRDDTGFSVSYDVEGPDDIEWSAKIGPEAQTEVVVSRILWGVGYHQPPIYYLPSWKLDRGEREPRLESEARFRPKLRDLERMDGFWEWRRNPFLGTPEFNGLLVILLMLNSTDLKDDNNSFYAPKGQWGDARRWFVVRDLGAALGETGKLYPRRNWLEGFERHGFLTRVTGSRVEFDYRGRHQELLRMITPADVRWGALRLRRLTDEQWRDAFRTANYPDPVAQRYIGRIKQKIDDGLALDARPQALAPLY